MVPIAGQSRRDGWNMPHTFICNLQHVVFGTKERRPWIAGDLQEPMQAYIGGIARQNGFKCIAVGVVADHAHLLLSLNGTMGISKAVQLVKAGSSKWFRETHERRFNWQEGFASFSVSKSNEPAVSAYVRNQEQHHRKRDFRAELTELLRRHRVEFEESMLD